MSEEKKKELTEEERKELKEGLKKKVDEMSDEELDKVAGGILIDGPDEPSPDEYGVGSDEKCQICGKTVSASMLKSHMNAHPQCGICGDRLLNNEDLGKHMAICHSVCPYCGSKDVVDVHSQHMIICQGCGHEW